MAPRHPETFGGLHDWDVVSGQDPTVRDVGSGVLSGSWKVSRRDAGTAEPGTSVLEAPIHGILGLPLSVSKQVLQDS